MLQAGIAGLYIFVIYRDQAAAVVLILTVDAEESFDRLLLAVGKCAERPALLCAQVDIEAVSSGESSRNTELVRALLQERQIEAIPVKMHQRREVLNIGGDLSEQLPLLQGGFAQPLEELETGIVQRVQAADEIDSGSLRGETSGLNIDKYRFWPWNPAKQPGFEEIVMSDFFCYDLHSMNIRQKEKICKKQKSKPHQTYVLPYWTVRRKYVTIM